MGGHNGCKNRHPLMAEQLPNRVGPAVPGGWITVYRGTFPDEGPSCMSRTRKSGDVFQAVEPRLASDEVRGAGRQRTRAVSRARFSSQACNSTSPSRTCECTSATRSRTPSTARLRRRTPRARARSATTRARPPPTRVSRPLRRAPYGRVPSLARAARAPRPRRRRKAAPPARRARRGRARS
jgi:hypothetical protein